MSKGKGRPFLMPSRFPIAQNDQERQTPFLIDIDDVSGAIDAKGMPETFGMARGKRVTAMTRYWTRVAYE